MEYFRNMKCEALPCSSWEQNFCLLYGGQNFAQTLQQNKKEQPADYFGWLLHVSGRSTRHETKVGMNLTTWEM